MAGVPTSGIELRVTAMGEGSGDGAASLDVNVEGPGGAYPGLLPEEVANMRSISLTILTVVLLAAAVGPVVSASKPAAAPRGPDTVAALLRRAATEPAGSALKTLHAATKAAEARHDRAASLRVASLANQLGGERLWTPEQAEARGFLQLALAIREKLLPGSAEHATTLYNLGESYRAEFWGPAPRRYAQALPLFERCLKIRERLAPASVELGWTLHMHGQVLSFVGDHPQAKSELERAQALFERLHRTDAEVAWSLWGLGFAARRRGDLAAAKAYCERVVAAGHTALGNPRMLSTGVDVATDSALLDLYEIARQDKQSNPEDFRSRRRDYLDRWLIARMKPPQKPEGQGPTVYRDPRTVTIVAMFRRMFQIIDTPDRAARWLAAAERIALTLPEPQRRAELLIIAQTAGARALDESYPYSERKYPLAGWALARQALPLLERISPRSREHASVLVSLAQLASADKDPSASDRYARRALTIVERLAPLTRTSAWAYSELYVHAMSRGETQAAAAIHDRVAAVGRGPLPDTLEAADGLDTLGVVAGSIGDLALQRSIWERAVPMYKARKHSWAGWILTNLGQTAYQQGDWDAARPHFRQALQELRALDYPPREAMRGLMYLAWVTQDDGLARAYGEKSLQLAEAHPASSGGTLYGSADHLVQVCIRQGDLAAARRTQQRALKIGPHLGDSSRFELGRGRIALLEGDIGAAKVHLLRAVSLAEKRSPDDWEVAYQLSALAGLLDEIGERTAAVEHLRRGLAIADKKLPDAPFVSRLLRLLSRLLVEQGATAEAETHLRRAIAIEQKFKTLTPDTPLAGFESAKVFRPEVRILEPGENSTITGSEVPLRLVFLAPIPLARYRISINGRPFGPAAGFDLPQLNAKGQVVDKGRVLDKGEVLDKGRVLDRGQVLDKGADREKLAKEVPAEIAELIRKPQYSHFLQLRHTVPVEDTDGEFLRITVQAETTGGSVSDRQVLRLRRPQAEQQRGGLRVLSVGVSEYEKLPKLGYAAADALALGDAFRGQAGESKLYRGVDLTVVTDGEATVSRLREALDQFTRNVQPGDTLVLALSGHGIRVGPPKVEVAGLAIDAMMALKQPEPRFYFAPVRFDPENAEGTGLPWSEVLAKLEVARKTAKAVWVLADTCRAAPGLRRESVATARDLKRGIDEGGNLILCAASEGDSPSYESEDLKHGIFTQAWLEALSGKGPEIVYEDRPLGKVLTLSGLQFAVDYSVRQHARKAGVRQQVEFPRLEGSFSPGQPVFVPVGQGG